MHGNQILSDAIERLVIENSATGERIAVITHEDVITASDDIVVRLKSSKLTSALCQLEGMDHFRSCLCCEFGRLCLVQLLLIFGDLDCTLGRLSLSIVQGSITAVLFTVDSPFSIFPRRNPLVFSRHNFTSLLRELYHKTVNYIINRPT